MPSLAVVMVPYGGEKLTLPRQEEEEEKRRGRNANDGQMHRCRQRKKMKMKEGGKERRKSVGVHRAAAKV